MLKLSAKNWKTTALLAVATVCLGTTATPTMAAGSIKAASVELVIPSRAVYFDRGLSNGVALATGPGTGTLGVTSITLTNFDATAQQVYIFAATVTTPGDCSSSVVGFESPSMSVYVQPNSTLHLSYPSPLVFHPISGSTCIGGNLPSALPGSAGVYIYVNGIAN